MIKIYIAKSLAIFSINFYHLGVAMNFTCTIHKEMDGIVTYSHNF
jgi:hypothetical protein